jgi:hypothetical protein
VVDQHRCVDNDRHLLARRVAIPPRSLST